MFRSARLVTLLCGLFTFSSCAWIMYPERRRQAPTGVVDTVPLVIDILWFIPGLIPGVICLVVDFSSGAIYTNGYGSVKVQKNGKVVMHRAPVTEATPAHVVITDGQGNVFAEQRVVWSPQHSQREDKVKLEISEDARIAHANGEELSLRVQLGDAEPAVFTLELAG